MNIVFMGTPDFAATVLRQVDAWARSRPGAAVRAVYCQPDRPAGRGQREKPPAVKVLAEELGLPVEQPLHFKDAAACERLLAYAPDVLVVAAYGLILPQTVLDIPTIGPFNVHGSLLPRLRGAAPIQRAIMQGDTVTGITIMRMEAGLDTGPMVCQRALVIGPDDTAATLHDELADLGGRLMAETLDKLLAGRPCTPVPQDDALATYAPKLCREDGLLRWDAPVAAVHAQLRGVTPWPGGRMTLSLDGRLLDVRVEPGRILERATEPERPGPEPGTVLGLCGDALAVACRGGVYGLTRLCPAGRRAMTAPAFWNGYVRGAADIRAILTT